jgi:hypothetical protein
MQACCSTTLPVQRSTPDDDQPIGNVSHTLGNIWQTLNFGVWSTGGFQLDVFTIRCMMTRTLIGCTYQRPEPSSAAVMYKCIHYNVAFFCPSSIPVRRPFGVNNLKTFPEAHTLLTCSVFISKCRTRPWQNRWRITYSGTYMKREPCPLFVFAYLILTLRFRRQTIVHVPA